MSLSPDPVLRGAGARGAVAADFAVDLSSALPTPVPSAMAIQAREAARTAGYADGWVQGQRAGRAVAQAAADQLAAEQQALAQAQAAAMRRALEAVARSATDLDARSVPALESITATILSTAVDLAEALLGYEVSHTDNAAPGGNSALAAVRRAMSLVPEGGPVTVRLHPDDYGCLARQGDTLHTDTGHTGTGHPSTGHTGYGHTGVGRTGEFTYAFEGRAITVRADPDLALGDAIAEYGVTTVDARLSTAMARVREVLSR